MLYKELEKKSENELAKILGEQRATLHDLQLKLSVNQLKDVRALRSTKRTIARILTKLQELSSAKDAQVNE
jgi:ribosomal protein L29